MRALTLLLPPGPFGEQISLSLELLLSPPGEHGSIHAPITDKEIYQKVLKFEEVEGFAEVNDKPIQEEWLSRTEALNAIATLQKYAIAMEDLVARKLEGILGSFCTSGSL